MENNSENTRFSSLGNGSQNGSQKKDSTGNQLSDQIERLKLACGAKSDSDLARALGISQQAVGSGKKKNQLPLSWFTRISERYGISIDWLVYGKGPKRREERPSHLLEKDSHIYIKEEAPGEREEERVVIPQWENPDLDYYDFIPMAEAHLSAGGGAFVLSENIKNYFAFRKDWLRKVATSVRNLVLMNVRGHSMEPTIQEGDTVLIDTGRKRIYDGCIYALGQGETVVIKRLELLAGMRARIISDNRTEFPPYEVSLRDLRILGQIIWYARELIRRE